MTTNVVNTTPYLRSSREYPDDVKQLSFQVNLTYVDIANAVNLRTIGLFPTSRPAITGESWYINRNQKQETFRQVYSFTTTANIPHHINQPGITNLSNIYALSNMHGTYTDGTNWYGLIAGTSNIIPGQISFYVSPTNIMFNVGAGAPALTQGIVVLEWLSLP